jgi:hypothetical protein
LTSERVAPFHRARFPTRATIGGSPDKIGSKLEFVKGENATELSDC